MGWVCVCVCVCVYVYVCVCGTGKLSLSPNLFTLLYRCSLEIVGEDPQLDLTGNSCLCSRLSLPTIRCRPALTILSARRVA